MKDHAEAITAIRIKYQNIASCLHEKGRRFWAATEAASYGWGGVAVVCKATGLSNKTVHKGLREVKEGKTSSVVIRQKGGGRKRIDEKQKGILDTIEGLVDPTARGDPESALRWTSKSTRKLSIQLNSKGFKIQYRTVGSLLKKLEYSLQSNKKSKEGRSHFDRDAQFNYINQSVMEFHKKGQPTISVDTKKKEIIGEYKNNGQEFCKQGQPVKVNTHDFPDKRLGKVVPYGVYDIGKNKGWVSVGISGDTAEFAVNTIRTWWYKMGQKIYSQALELLITADCGGSNGYRVRLWKIELQKFANETGLAIRICHFPPGTSKWNKIEHRMFSYISINWRGKPLVTRETVVNLIGNTRTERGLEIQSILDENEYLLGKEVSDEELAAVNMEANLFHPEWNYMIKPNAVL